MLFGLKEFKHLFFLPSIGTFQCPNINLKGFPGFWKIFYQPPEAYGFTPEDLLVCRQQLMLFVNQYEQVPYKAGTVNAPLV